MSDTTHDADQGSSDTPAGGDEGRHIPSADQDVASGQPYDPRKDPGTPQEAQEEAPGGAGVNHRDPAEGPDDESGSDG